MNVSLDSTPVQNVMTRIVFTVKPNDRISAVASQFSRNDISAAPVVDGSNVCIGIITSRDLVDYESLRISVLRNLDRHLEFESDFHPVTGSNPFLPASIDEVRVQMTSKFESIESQATLFGACQIMCQKHVHHLVVLDDANHPVGMLSSLDILSHISGTPINRKMSGA